MTLRQLIRSLAVVPLLTGFVFPAMAEKAEIPGGLVHEAEFQRLWGQNGGRWAEEDNEIQAKLAELEAKFGKKPNIIHVLWDDMRYGAVGHRLLTDIIVKNTIYPSTYPVCGFRIINKFEK